MELPADVQDIEVEIRTIPSPKGDEVRTTKLSTLSPNFFKMPFWTIVNGVRVDTWDELMVQVRKAQNNSDKRPEVLQIERGAAVGGG